MTSHGEVSETPDPIGGEKRRLQWARQLGLPDNTPMDVIKEKMRERSKKNRDQRAA